MLKENLDKTCAFQRYYPQTKDIEKTVTKQGLFGSHDEIIKTSVETGKWDVFCALNDFGSCQEDICPLYQFWKIISAK